MASKTTPPTAPPRRPTVTPDALSSLNKRMSVDKNVVDELLLVCGVLCTIDDDTGQLVPVEDCLNWLQDLQRALRRDDDLYRPISLLLGQWKVVHQKLLPLVLSCRYDTAMVLTICKILVILTKPLAENTVRAGKMVIDTQKTGPRYVF
jgi:timeless